MIYTITFNPAVDLVMQVPEVVVGELNRSQGDAYVAGGKGINASFIFKRLGHENIATGFVGGFSGQYIESCLEAEKIETHFIHLDGTTRINVKLKGKKETEINASGPTVEPDKFNRLLTYLSQAVNEKDVVFLAGNTAPGLDVEAYRKIGKLCLEKGAHFILDTNNQLLLDCLEFKPFLIKPNQDELGEMFDVKITSGEELVHYAKKLQEKGAKNVLVSLGGSGSVLLTQDGECYSANVPKGKVINSVGAGDSMLAGFVSKYIETGNYEDSLQYGAATGSATAFSVGIAEEAFINQLIPQIQVINEIKKGVI